MAFGGGRWQRRPMQAAVLAPVHRLPAGDVPEGRIRGRALVTVEQGACPRGQGEDRRPGKPSVRAPVKDARSAGRGEQGGGVLRVGEEPGEGPGEVPRVDGLPVQPVVAPQQAAVSHQSPGRAPFDGAGRQVHHPVVRASVGPTVAPGRQRHDQNRKNERQKEYLTSCPPGNTGLSFPHLIVGGGCRHGVANHRIHLVSYLAACPVPFPVPGRRSGAGSGRSNRATRW